MPGMYSITNLSTTGGGTQQAMSTAFVGAILGVTAPATPRRGALSDILVGTNGTPADNYITWDVSRVTASSTATLLAPFPMDPADAAAVSTVSVNSSTFATIGTPSVWGVGVNQRASYRWVAAPGSEIIWPATASNGLQLRALSGGYTGTGTGAFIFQEF